ncbi:MAG TPA: hypothetical protein VMK65_09950 [Longimicrobiales bacterium]|nr:hypothetical protein [Longimicrobiales bacterium]
MSDRLEGLAALEAHRAGLAFEPDPARIAQGWAFRFIADGPRVLESAALYRELGFEVCDDPVPARSLSSQCSDCQLVAALRFRALYTRRPRPTG